MSENPGRIKYGGIVAGKEEINAAVKVLEGQGWGQGPVVESFERQAAIAVMGVPYALFVNSGSSALLLAMATLPRGSRIAMPALQFPTLYSAAIWCGHEPVLVDVDESLNMDPEKLRSCAEVVHIDAVAFVAMAGNMTNFDQVRSWCWSTVTAPVPVILDLCEGFGASLGGASLPSGSVVCTSTHAAHHISTGEGGLAFCWDEPTWAKMHRIRDWGRAYGTASIEGYYENYVFTDIGLNLHATDIQAALGLVQLEKLAEFRKMRNLNHAQFVAAFEHLPVTIPRAAVPKPGEVDPVTAGQASWYAFPFLTDHRDELRAHLEKRGIETRPILVGNLARQPLPGMENVKPENFPVADDVFRRGLWFSVHPQLEYAARHRIIHAMYEFFARVHR